MTRPFRMTIVLALLLAGLTTACENRALFGNDSHAPESRTGRSNDDDQEANTKPQPRPTEQDEPVPGYLLTSAKIELKPQTNPKLPFNFTLEAGPGTLVPRGPGRPQPLYVFAMPVDFRTRLVTAEGISTEGAPYAVGLSLAADGSFTGNIQTPQGLVLLLVTEHDKLRKLAFPGTPKEPQAAIIDPSRDALMKVVSGADFPAGD